MRIHTAVGEAAPLHRFAREVGVTFARLDHKRSRSRAHGWDLILAGSGGRGMGYGNQREDYQAATWDEWGDFLARLYRLDPTAKAGPYVCADHFTWATGGRYGGEAYTRHARHRWTHNGGESVTRVYFVSECRCGAVRRTLYSTSDGDFTSWRAIAPRPTPTPAESQGARLARLVADVADLRAQVDAVYGDDPRTDPEYPYDPSSREYASTWQEIELVHAGGDMPPAAEPWTPTNRRAVRV